MRYSFRLTARVLLYAPSHRQNSTYHDLCYTSRVRNWSHFITNLWFKTCPVRSDKSVPSSKMNLLMAYFLEVAAVDESSMLYTLVALLQHCRTMLLRFASKQQVSLFVLVDDKLHTVSHNSLLNSVSTI